MSRTIRYDDPAVTDEAVAVLRSGRAIVLPTDTVYGLAAIPTSRSGMDEVFSLKQRPDTVTVAVLVASVDQARGLAVGLDDRFEELVARHWPGPLTLVVDRRPGLGFHLGADESTIGVRCPAHALTRGLAGIVGPLATTSANPHGVPTPATLPEVIAALGAPELAIDGGRCAEPPSTVVRLSAVGDLTMIRKGAVEVDLPR